MSPEVRSRTGALLRGAAAVAARPYRQAAPVQEAPAPQPPAADHPRVAPAAGATVEPVPAGPAMPRAEHPGPERRTTIRRAADLAGAQPSFRLGDVYAEELTRLREQARVQGYAAGHAEGVTAAATVVAEVEREAAQRLAEAQARWERRLASATAALTAAASRLDETLAPTGEELRDALLAATGTLLEDLFGRELALSASPVMDAVHRALTLRPADAPAVVRLHPDDLADVPADELAGLPATVRVVGDPAVERAGAVVESGPRRIDAQLGAALERVRAVLAP